MEKLIEDIVLSFQIPSPTSPSVDVDVRAVRPKCNTLRVLAIFEVAFLVSSGLDSGVQYGREVAPCGAVFVESEV